MIPITNRPFLFTYIIAIDITDLYTQRIDD
jgi:hypothetical protein